MHVILAVFKRNLASYLSGVLGYLFMAAFLIGSAIAAFNESFFANNLANLDQLNLAFPILLVGLIPAITMSTWADERRFGTDELLFTLPATDLQILIGKYLAAAGVFTITLLFAFAGLLAALFYMGRPDIGLICSAFIGYWLAGCALVAAGMVSSAASRSPTVAYLLGLLTTGVPAALYFYPAYADYSVSNNLRDFGLGIVAPAGVLYFVSLTVLMLFINYVLITGRFWSTGPGRAAALVGLFTAVLVPLVLLLAWWNTFNTTTAVALGSRVAIAALLAAGAFGAYALAKTNREMSSALRYATEFVALGVTLVSINQAIAAWNYPLDLTSERLYSITQSTEDVLKGLKPDQVVRVNAFISPDVPRQYAATRNTLVGLLREYDRYNNVIVRIVETRRYTPQAREAKDFQIEPQVLQNEQGGRVVTSHVYMGVVLSAAGREVRIPFFDQGTPVEYELTRSIHTLVQPERKKVGILRTDAKVGGGFDMGTFQQTREWRIVTELKKQYDVKDVDPAELATSKFDVLLAVMPSSLNDQELPHLVKYVKDGNPTLIVDDPFPLFHPNLAPLAEKPRPGGMFGQGQPPQPKAEGGSLRSLLSTLEISWTPGQTVWDTYDPEIELSAMFSPYDVVYVGKDSGARDPFNKENPISAGLQEVMTFYPGSIKSIAKDKWTLDHEPLLRCSPDGYTKDWSDYTEQQMSMFGGGGAEPKLNLPREKGDGDEHVLAMHLRGRKTKDSAAKRINAVVIADLDMISDPFFMVRDKVLYGLQLDNVAFVLNAVDVLGGDTANVDLRTRRGQHRTLSRVDRTRKELRRQEIKKTKEIETGTEKAIENAKKRFADRIKAVENDTSISEAVKPQVIQALQEDEQRRLTIEIEQLNREKDRETEELKESTQSKILAEEARFRWGAVFGITLPAILLGLWVFGRRVAEENQGIVPDRMVKKRR